MGRDAGAAHRDRRRDRLPARRAALAGHRRAGVRNRRSRSRVVWRSDATVRRAARASPPAPAGARTQPASLRDVAGARHPGPGAGRPRAGGRAPEPIGGALLRRARGLHHRADAARRGADGGDERDRWRALEDGYSNGGGQRAAGARLRTDPPHRRQHGLVLRQPAVEDAGPDRSVDGRDWDGRPAPRSGSLHGRRRDRRLDGGRLRARRSHAPPRRHEAAGAWLVGVRR